MTNSVPMENQHSKTLEVLFSLDEPNGHRSTRSESKAAAQADRTHYELRPYTYFYSDDNAR